MITDQKELFVTMATNAWDNTAKRVTKLLDTLTDDQWMLEVAPGRNRGIYVLGHLVAVNDSMLSILGLGGKKYPQLEEVFLAKPDKSGLPMPALGELKDYWKDSLRTLADHFDSMDTADWFSRHMSVSEEDFAKEPHRNKLNVLLSRTNHMDYHRGQLVLLQPR